jgi:hypothetical protein
MAARYINNIGTTYQEKINKLITLHDAEITDNEWQPELVVVVDNGYFAAARYVYDKREYDEMLEDGRPKTWLMVPGVKDLVK